MGFLGDGPYGEPSLPSLHRHGYRHRENGLDKWIPRQGDGHDDDDGLLQLYS
jgi:hypothetical protein